MAYKDLVYCACPARLGNSKPAIMEYVASRNKGPLHPFSALPHEYFEGGRVGREKTMEVCCRLIDICNEFWLFGISEGTLLEATYFFEQAHGNNRKVRVLVDEFDSEWQRFANQYVGRYAATLHKLGLGK